MTEEWERRRWRNRVHLTVGGCLGPCVLANVTMLIFDGRTLYFQSLNNEALVLALLDYIDAMLAADAYLPPPSVLADLHFTSFRWEDRPDGCTIEDRTPPRVVVVGGAGWVRVPHSGGHGPAGAGVGGGAAAGGFSARPGVRDQPSQGRRRRGCVPGLRAAGRGGHRGAPARRTVQFFARTGSDRRVRASKRRVAVVRTGYRCARSGAHRAVEHRAYRWRTKCSPICSSAGRELRAHAALPGRSSARRWVSDSMRRSSNRATAYIGRSSSPGTIRHDRRWACCSIARTC